MPAGDRTGPYGMGPGTGQRRGYCAGYEHPGYMFGNRGIRCGSFGGGRGRGFRHWFHMTGLPRWFRLGQSSYRSGNPQFTKDDEVRFLREQADFFSKSLDEINERLGQLENQE